MSYKRLCTLTIICAAWILISTPISAAGEACTTTTITAPSPLMGNHGEIFRTAEGEIYEVLGSYEYLYAYYPSAIVCPAIGKMQVEGKTIGIRAIQTAGRPALSPPTSRSQNAGQPNSDGAPIHVVFRISGCDYFIADGPRGLYLLEWYGGYDPSRGDGILGELQGYGFKDILYADGREGRVYVDDYLLSKDSAIEKIAEKCE